MLPRHHPDRIRIAFDDHRLVTNAGLVLPATLALHLGLPHLVDRRLDLGCAPGPAFLLSVWTGHYRRPSGALITQISGCEALVLQYGADCITSVVAELRQEPRR